jgi:pilus assembly protein Flp/PilA
LQFGSRDVARIVDYSADPMLMNLVVMLVLGVPVSSHGTCSPARRRQEGKMKQLMKNFLNDESGATAIEYGLIAAGIALAIIVAVNTVGKLGGKAPLPTRCYS